MMVRVLRSVVCLFTVRSPSFQVQRIAFGVLRFACWPLTPTLPLLNPHTVNPQTPSHPLGLLDLNQCTKLVRFTQQANLLGLPAIVLPVGTGATTDRTPGDARGPAPNPKLPVALQLIGQPWHDASLLRTACILEEALRSVNAPVLLPALAVNPLVKPVKAGSPKAVKPASPKKASVGCAKQGGGAGKGGPQGKGSPVKGNGKQRRGGK